MKKLIITLFVGFTLLLSSNSLASDCYESMIVSPSPFMGNNEEIFKLQDGTIWEVKYEYEYMYEYYPTILVCENRGFIIVNEKKLNVVKIK